MHRPMLRRSIWFLPLLLLLSLGLLLACTRQSELSVEQRAQELDRSLMCPVCPGETIEQSQNELAKQMRTLVREKLAAGESREQVLEFFVDRYGVGVLAAPPKQGFNLLAWLFPLIVLAAGGAATALVIRSMRARPRPVPARSGAPADPDLAPYLERVDQEFALFQQEKAKSSLGKKKPTERS